MKVLGLFLVVCFLSGCVTPEQQLAAQRYLEAQGDNRSMGEIMTQGARDLNSINQSPQSQTCHIVDLGGGLYRQQCN